MVTLRLSISYDLSHTEELIINELLNFEGKIITPSTVRNTLETILEDTVKGRAEDKYIKVLLSRAIEEKYNFQRTLNS